MVESQPLFTMYTITTS